METFLWLAMKCTPHSNNGILLAITDNKKRVTKSENKTVYLWYTVLLSLLKRPPNIFIYQRPSSPSQF